MTAQVATYSPSAGDRLVPGAASVTELGTSVGGFVASCAFAAYAAVQHVVTGSPASSAEDTALTQQAVNEHQTVGKFAKSGQATPANIKYIAGMHGVNFLDLTQSQALSVAGVDPVEIGVSNARAFGGADSNVSGHYVTLLGRTAKGGLITSDPNQPQSARGQLNVYTEQQLTNARPFWFGAPSASSGAGTGASAGVVSPAAYTPPGFPGPIWSPTTNIAQGAAQGAAQTALGGLDLGGMIQSVLTAFTTALKRIGVFAVGLALIAIGLYVAFRPQIQATGKSVGRKAGKAALLAA